MPKGNCNLNCHLETGRFQTGYFNLIKLHKSAASKMSSVQPKNFRKWETLHFKMPRLETPCFQMAVKLQFPFNVT